MTTNHSVSTSQLDQVLAAHQASAFHYAARLIQAGVPQDQAMQTVMLSTFRHFGASPQLAMDLTQELMHALYQRINTNNPPDQQQLKDLFFQAVRESPSLQAKLKAFDSAQAQMQTQTFP